MTQHNRGRPIPDPEQRLCLACGLCCNGVLFRDIELQPADDPRKLSALGLPLEVRRARGVGRIALEGGRTVIRSPQPCAALLGCRCTLYPERPTRCWQFDCALLVRLRAGELDEPGAVRIVQTTRKKAEAVIGLLRQLDDHQESRALSLRFQGMRHRMERVGEFDEEQAEVYAALTLAVHDLQQRLRMSFYP